jgi:hypothetical protein
MALGGSCPAAEMTYPQTLARRGSCPATTGLFMRPRATPARFVNACRLDLKNVIRFLCVPWADYRRNGCTHEL